MGSTLASEAPGGLGFCHSVQLASLNTLGAALSPISSHDCAGFRWGPGDTLVRVSWGGARYTGDQHKHSTTCEPGHIPGGRWWLLIWGRVRKLLRRNDAQAVSSARQKGLWEGRGAPQAVGPALEAGRCVPERPERCSGEAPNPRWTKALDRCNGTLTPGHEVQVEWLQGGVAPGGWRLPQELSRARTVTRRAWPPGSYVSYEACRGLSILDSS